MKEKALARGLSSSYLEGGDEDDDDEEGGGVSLMAIKKQYKANSKREWGDGSRRGWGYDEERGGVSLLAIKKQYKANSKREWGVMEGVGV